LDRRDDDYDVAGNPNLLPDLSGKNQHQFILLRRTPGTLESRPNTLVFSKGICGSIFDISFNRVQQYCPRNTTQQKCKAAHQKYVQISHGAVLCRW
jgi:hypothetical protein